jgi:hypothetical protein
LAILSILLLLISSVAAAGERFSKVVWIVFENPNFANPYMQADFAKLAKSGASFTNISTLVNPAQGNYISMIAGSNLGVQADTQVNLRQNHVGDLLEEANLDWKVYAEDYPGNCFTASQRGKFVRRNVPFLSFTNVTNNPKRCTKIENEIRFEDDFKNGTLPAFSMYIPNVQNNGHITTIDYSGRWLTNKLGRLFSKPDELNEVLFIITFDEANPKAPNDNVYTVMLGANIRPGVKNTQPITHPALLKMIEDEFNIGSLRRGDLTAPVLGGIWKQ